MASYSETLDRIYNLRGGIIDLRLDRVAGTLKLFSHPERKFRCIHIAGTNGKGSTSAILQRILSLAGYRTALYTSPHLVAFTERIKIGDEKSPKLSGGDRRRDLATHLDRRYRAHGL
jgi:dihydrofolate synthase/folylpolyglutamate synthase